MVSISTAPSDKFIHNIPASFICPLTLEIMSDPLMNRYGQSYERSAIVHWITTRSPSCPMTRRPMQVKDLIPNNRLRKKILDWREQQGDDTSNERMRVETAVVAEEIFRALNEFRIPDLESNKNVSQSGFLRRLRLHRRNQ